MSVAQLCEEAGWQEVRASSVMHSLLREGLCLLDRGDPSGTELYWFPCIEVQQIAVAT